MTESRAYGTRYRLEYNRRRPHSALGHKKCGGVSGRLCGGVCGRDHRLEGVGAWRLRPLATLRPQPHSLTPEYNLLPVSRPVLS